LGLKGGVTGMTKFSDRHGYQPDDAEITVRLEAPHELRAVVVDIAYESGLTPHQMRTLVCRALRTRQDPNNWSAFPNVDNELRRNLDDCEWYEVYDVVEAVYDQLRAAPTGKHQGREAAYFEAEINKYFRRKGIGWQLAEGIIETRGAEGFERALSQVRTELTEASRTTAANEVHQAISDLSRRPQPDVTGAIQHALAALECVARDVTGDSRATLGSILARHPGLIPPPLDQGVEKLWGYATEQGRHLREGRVPSYEEAELAVQVASAVCLYLSKKSRT
jgi:hypothetical protein